jgi:membrane associated rhomboid family serine protease
MVGASAIVSGLMGAAATFAFDAPEAASETDVLPVRGPARIWHGLRRMMANRTAMFFLGSWFVMNLAFGVLASPLGIADAAIAWEAHVGGLLAGLILFPLLDPGPQAWQHWPHGV